MAGRWSLAWRVLDAQYWGVPQRRRRIALVVDFGGDTAGEILFECQSMCRDIDTGGTERKGTSQGASGRTQDTVWCIKGNAIDRDTRRNGGQSRDSIFYKEPVDNIEYSPDISRTLLAKSACSMAYDLETYCVQNKYVRRLTPLECERLQGFPDGWTDIGDYIDSNGRKRKTSDSARYKALGNSIAIPPWRWVLNRICSHLGDKPTMASLFDGIGGFPLIWEEICGKGTCLWASEIEEFPMAVTNKKINM